MKKHNISTNMINREFSWLEFNKRVLFEAEEIKNPVLERLKFLSIVSSNLEEFFMIRVAVLRKQKEANISESSDESMTPAEQLSIIRGRVLELLKRQYDLLYNQILPELRNYGINILVNTDEAELIKELLAPVFDNEMLPMLTPLSVGPAHPFPTLVTGRLYLAVGLRPLENNFFIEKSDLSFIEIPTNIYGRFMSIDSGDTLIPVENIIKIFINKVFNGYIVTSAHIIRVTRDADLSVQEDGASDLLKEIESTIKRMHRRSVVKIEYESGIPPEILNTIREKNLMESEELYEISGIFNLKDLMELYEKKSSEAKTDKSLIFKPITPIYSSEFYKKDIFKVIDESDIILFHPYHSFDPVLDLLNRAAVDPDVMAIKQTLYRTSSNSAIIQALIKAAENGKYVSVIDELKARFDEKRNIEWARRLEDSGAHVTYGVAGLKTHAKALIIVRKEERGIKRYVHLGTGNYNESTAKLYTDFSFFTSDDKFGEDISSFFNLLTGFSLSDRWNYITIAPLELRQKFINLIVREKNNALNGLKAKITAKLNSLVDDEIISVLYDASKAGVKINLIVRGICSLKPGLPGLSENIRIASIIGRYLEHSRIFCFQNAGDEEIYLSSADWMSRNLDRRVEILFPIRNEKNRAFIRKILTLQFDDNVNKWDLLGDKYSHIINDNKKVTSEKDSFKEIYELIKKNDYNYNKKNTVELKPVKSEQDR